MNPTLGKLERIDLRDAWMTEAGEFTPWLAQMENLALLGEAIGLDLELEAQEKTVGPFRADILCKEQDSPTEHWVLIENQLERTDHCHLGQLLTYAAGLNAVTIVWIAAQFAEEHRATLDWLNEITDERFQVFGLEVELWRIEKSPAAPKFNVVSAPNDWRRSVDRGKRTISGATPTETKVRQQEYWDVLRSYLKAHRSPVRMGKPQPQSWMTFAIGRSGIWLTASMNTLKHWIGVELTLGDADAKAYFDLLSEERELIEGEFGTPLDWQKLSQKKSSRIAVYKRDTDPMREGDWPSQNAWMADMLYRFNKSFRERIKKLDPEDWQPDEPAVPAATVLPT
jgi:hypothetical protein